MLQHHPVLDMHFLELPITINTDDPSVSQTTLTDEYALVIKGLGISQRELHQMIVNAAKAAFLPEDKKQELITSVRRELGTSRYRGLEP